MPRSCPGGGCWAQVELTDALSTWLDLCGGESPEKYLSDSSIIYKENTKEINV